VIVRLVVSHVVEFERFGSLLVKTTLHETVSVAVTLTLVFDVFRVAGDVAFVSVNVSAGRSTVPVQSLLLYSVNDRLPLRGEPPPDVTVAESFGSQFCADATDEVSVTTKHSLSPTPLSVDGR
jgi:hypothetical protein